MENFSSEMTGNCEIYSRVFQKSREMIECSRDFILPDFYADIKRIISTSGNISPETCFVEGGKASVSGTLTTRVLFIDDEGKLRSVTFTQDYSATIPVGDSASYDEISIMCCPTLESVSVKTVNPRKVSVRGRIDAGIKIWKKMSISPEMPPVACENGFCPEIRTESVSCMAPFSVWERDLELSEDIILDGEAEDIIYCDAKSEVLECSVENDGIGVKGNINIDVIYSPSDGGDPIHVSRRVPFSRTVETDLSALSNIVCSACSYIRSVDCALSGDNSGENNKIEIDVGYALAVNGAGTVSCQYVSDMYLPAYALKTESEKINFSSEPTRTVKNIRVESCGGNPLPEGSSVVLTTIQPQIESLSNEDGMRRALGSSQINVVYRDASGNLSSQGFTDEFEIELKDVPEFDEYIFLLRSSAVNARNEENSLCVGYDLEITVVSWQSEMSEMIVSSQVSANESVETRKPFTVYYPAKNETLWDIGKKYNVTVAELMAANPENDEGDGGVPSVLLIPRHKPNKPLNL